MVLPDSDGVSRVPPYSGYWAEGNEVSLTGLSPSLADLPKSFNYFVSLVTQMSSPTTPESKLSGLGCSFSLAATQGIEFSFSSYGYLDVSVPHVYLPTELCIHSVITGLYSCWVSPFGNLRITVYLQLPEAYRS